MNEDKYKLLAFADVLEVIPGNPEDAPQPLKAPQEILVLKFGKNKFTQDGTVNEFDFDENDADAIINEFESRGRDLVVDYEHANLIKGQPAPAAGWVSKLMKTRDGLLACIKNWTGKAKEYLESGEYRYQSPVIHLNDRNRPDLLQSIGLTNHPALHGPVPLLAATDSSVVSQEGSTKEQTIDVFKNRIIGLKQELDSFGGGNADVLKTDLNREIVAFCDYAGRCGENVKSDAQGFIDVLFLSDLTDSHKPKKTKGKSQMETLKQLAKLVGLADKAVKPEDEMLVTDTTMTEELPAPVAEGEAAPTADEKATLDKVMKAVEELVKMKDMIAEALGVEANLDAIMAKLAELSGRPTATEVADVTEQVAMTDAKLAVETAMKSGKIAKSFEKWATDYAKRDPKAFKAFTDSIPDKVAPVPNNLALNDIATQAPAATAAPKYSSVEVEMAKHFGNPPEVVYGNR